MFVTRITHYKLLNYKTTLLGNIFKSHPSNWPNLVQFSECIIAEWYQGAEVYKLRQSLKSE